MTSSMKYPTGIQDFGKLRENGYAYVDKTMYVKMMEESPNYYFLSRPRRFGKSLFVSTLEAYYNGRRDLFRGLYIDSDDMDWTPRPVIKFSLNTVDPKSESALYETLDNSLSFYEDLYKIDVKINAPAERFQNLLRTVYQESQRKVVVLIDEYDAPLLNILENEKLSEAYRDTLRTVFSVLKNADAFIHCAFITGVSRFSHTSLFSGANNLKDISLDDRFAAICGISEAELKSTFIPGIREFAKSKGLSEEIVLRLLKENYDGYHFSKRSPDIYNPFSLLNALQSQEISDYWFESGTPSSFLKALKRDNFYLPNLDCIETIESDLSARESYLQNPITLMYEAGYITIKKYDEELQTYTLGLPNQEVATSFSRALLPIYSDRDTMDCRDSFNTMRKAVLKGEPDKFMEHLQIFLQGNPYSNTELAKRERYFKNNIFLVFKALGFMPRVEEETCNSRMDVMLRTSRYIYIFELKTDGNVDEAMRQIDNRGYAHPYSDEGRKIILIAANYSSTYNNIDEWRIKM